MKSMTCKDLGGACDLKFEAETFEEIATQSKAHGMDMFKKGEKAHLEAMLKMTELMKNPEHMKQWFNQKKTEFEKL